MGRLAEKSMNNAVTAMATSAMQDQEDAVIPFQLLAVGVRGRATKLNGLLNELLNRHAYPAGVEAIVAECAVLTALIGQTIDLKWKLSMQIRGNGPLHLIASDYIAPASAGRPARMRVYANFDPTRVAANSGGRPELIGAGYLGLIVDRGGGRQPYQGLTPLQGKSLSTCAETYFLQSEQLPTRFVVKVARQTDKSGDGIWRASGIVIQHMPRSSKPINGALPTNAKSNYEKIAASTDTDEDGWRRANMFLDTVGDGELTGSGVSLPRLLHRLFHSERILVSDWQPLEFGCTCSPAKVRQGLSIYSAKDIARMTTAEGVVTADCQFCGARYRFEPSTLGFEATEGRGDPSE